MNDSDKVLTYEEAKQLCMKAFDGGARYGSESMRYGVNARAYDWDHWLKENEGLFKPEPTVEDVLREFAEGLGVPVADSYIAASAAKLRLAEGVDE
jgi:hypothetical protein